MARLGVVVILLSVASVVASCSDDADGASCTLEKVDDAAALLQNVVAVQGKTLGPSAEAPEAQVSSQGKKVPTKSSSKKSSSKKSKKPSSTKSKRSAPKKSKISKKSSSKKSSSKKSSSKKSKKSSAKGSLKKSTTSKKSKKRKQRKSSLKKSKKSSSQKSSSKKSKKSSSKNSSPPKTKKSSTKKSTSKGTKKIQKTNTTKTTKKTTNKASVCPNPNCAGSQCCYKKKFSDGDKCGRPTCDKNLAQRTKKNTGERFCHFCQKHSKADKATLATCFSATTDSKTWKSGSVTMSSCRRRFTKGTCKTKNCYHPSHVPIRPLNRGIVFGDWESVLNGEKMCGCVAYFLKACAGKDNGCMEKMICACPGVCPEFKKEMKCPEAAQESSNATSLTQRRDLVGQASQSENGLDDAVRGKCTSETQ